MVYEAWLRPCFSMGVSEVEGTKLSFEDKGVPKCNLGTRGFFQPRGELCHLRRGQAFDGGFDLGDGAHAVKAPYLRSVSKSALVLAER